MLILHFYIFQFAVLNLLLSIFFPQVQSLLVHLAITESMDKLIHTPGTIGYPTTRITGICLTLSKDWVRTTFPLIWMSVRMFCSISWRLLSEKVWNWPLQILLQFQTEYYGNCLMQTKYFINSLSRILPDGFVVHVVSIQCLNLVSCTVGEPGNQCPPGFHLNTEGLYCRGKCRIMVDAVFH